MRGRLIFAFTLALAAVAVVARAADEFDEKVEVCKFHRPTFEASPTGLPKVKRVEDATVNGVKIPAYSLSTEDASQESGMSTYTPHGKPFAIKLKPEIANQLEAYATPMGTILAPKGWAPVAGAEGADGSFRIAFAPDRTGRAYLSLESTGNCAGCAFLASSMYFGHAVAREEDDPLFTCLKPDFVHAVPLNPDQMAYTIKADAGNPIDGVAYYNTDVNVVFYDVQVSMPASQHAMASVLLNQFVIPKKSK